jgi:beta-galactosidase
MSDFHFTSLRAWVFLILALILQQAISHPTASVTEGSTTVVREHLSINRDWKFLRFSSNPDSLSYDSVLKSWVLPSANDFIVNGTKHTRPSGTPPGSNVQYVQPNFDDSSWESVDLPHDWAIKGPFGASGISGGMGRLPSNGVGWYRRNLTVTNDDVGKFLFLDVDGAQSHASVWLNGVLVGGWPYGYSSFRLDLTPYVQVGHRNTLAIRLENAADSSRWYPGAGIYRNIWLVKVNPIHVGQYGTRITTPSVSADKATVGIGVDVENRANSTQNVVVRTVIYPAGSDEIVATFPEAKIQVTAHTKQSVQSSVTISNPKLWGPPPTQTPNLYKAVTTVLIGNSSIVDEYETQFGIRSVKYDGTKGLIVNGEAIRTKGTNNHHDLGSLGAAFNVRAAERQLQTLQEMGSNALRTSHNPPAPEFLDLADRLGFVVMDEAFDAWTVGKVSNDYHLLFSDWHEPDLRSFVRRDLNHPSVILWSIGNEIPEKRSSGGAANAKTLRDIVHSEDPTRPVTMSFDQASPSDTVSNLMDVLSLNYVGEGAGTSTGSEFPGFHSAYPDKLLWTSESAATTSTRGTYLFPVTGDKAQSVSNGQGGNSTSLQVSAYELYSPVWATSPDKVFTQQDTHSYVAGEFVWTGWDYLGEPTPYGYNDAARSSYFGIVDLAGFKKDRFYLYQSRWRPDLPSAHILPHWNWPDRVGKVTPVHVFSSADEAELFVNGQSAGRLAKQSLTYRFRWDNVTYSPGNLYVVTYKNGKVWAEASKRTVGSAAALNMTADRTSITADGYDLSFITVAVTDGSGDTVPYATDSITFSLSGPGQIVSTDNGNPADQTSFASLTRKAFSGLALAIVRTRAGQVGQITVSATAHGLKPAQVTLVSV